MFTIITFLVKTIVNFIKLIIQLAILIVLNIVDFFVMLYDKYWTKKLKEYKGEDDF